MSKLNASVEKLAIQQEDWGNNVFPAQPEQNPKGQYPGSSSSGHEHAKAVTVLRSGKIIGQEDPSSPVNNGKEREEIVNEDVVGEKESETYKLKEKKLDGNEEIKRRPGKEPQPDEAPKNPFPAPYPQRLRKPQKATKSQEFLELFKQVKINLLLLDAINQVPAYAKFPKDLCIVKRR